MEISRSNEVKNISVQSWSDNSGMERSTTLRGRTEQEGKQEDKRAPKSSEKKHKIKRKQKKEGKRNSKVLRKLKKIMRFLKKAFVYTIYMFLLSSIVTSAVLASPPPVLRRIAFLAIGLYGLLCKLVFNPLWKVHQGLMSMEVTVFLSVSLPAFLIYWNLSKCKSLFSHLRKHANLYACLTLFMIFTVLLLLLFFAGSPYLCLTESFMFLSNRPSFFGKHLTLCI